MRGLIGNAGLRIIIGEYFANLCQPKHLARRPEKCPCGELLFQSHFGPFCRSHLPDSPSQRDMIVSRSFRSLMVRSAFLFPVFLLCSSALIAQDPDPAPAANQPAVTSTVSPEIQQFQKIEDNWSTAVNQRDQYGLELVLSPLFVDVSAVGDVTTRNQQVATLISNEDKTLHISQRVVAVRMLGDIAVANGTYDLHHKVNSSQVDEKGVFTQVFERAHGGWLCINSQRTLIREDANGKQSNSKQKKQSTADLPFHVPLFSKN
jgi:ketosteroid isomerase-like protein